MTKVTKFLPFLTIVIFLFVSEANSQIRTGGYANVAVTREDVAAAANFAVEKQSQNQEISISLESIEKAEIQTVAGTNYRLCLKVYSTIEDENSETMTVKVIVFRNLQGDYSLTSWTEEDCP